MQNNAKQWQEFSLNITERELKGWRLAFKKEKARHMLASKLPSYAYPWNDVAKNIFRTDRPDIKGLDFMILTFAVTRTRNPIKKGD